MERDPLPRSERDEHARSTTTSARDDGLLVPRATISHDEHAFAPRLQRATVNSNANTSAPRAQHATASDAHASAPRLQRAPIGHDARAPLAPRATVGDAFECAPRAPRAAAEPRVTRAKARRRDEPRAPRTTCVVFLGHLLVIEDAATTRPRGDTVEVVTLHDGLLRVTTATATTTGEALVLPPRSALAVSGRGTVARLHVEAHSFDGRALRQALGPSPSPLAVAHLGRRVVDGNAWDAIARLDFVTAAARMLAGLDGRARRRPVNAPVRQLLARLERDAAPLPPIAELARDVDVPMDRLRGMVAQMTGMTIGTYASWQRLKRLCATLRPDDLDGSAERAGYRSRRELLLELERGFGMSERELVAGRWLAR